MNRREYSAGAVKFSFWFMEFKAVVKLLSEGMILDEVKEKNKRKIYLALRQRFVQVRYSVPYQQGSKHWMYHFIRFLWIVILQRRSYLL